MIAFLEYVPLLAWGWRLVLLLGAFWLLAACADVLVSRGVELSGRLGVPPLLIGLLLVSAATTVPEMSVSVIAALSRQPEVAIGNAIGSVVCNTGLALGLCAMVSSRPIHVNPVMLRITGGFLLVNSSLVLLFVAGDGKLTRGEGLVMLLLLAVYLSRLLRTGFLSPVERVAAVGGVADQRRKNRCRTSLFRPLAWFLVGVAGVVLAGRLALACAVSIAADLGVPQSLIALSIVALGTSMPEIAAGVQAARRGYGEIAVGNILGASLLNLSWVIGTAALIAPLTMPPRDAGVMFAGLFIFLLLSLLLLKTQSVITKIEGLLLLAVYLVYLLVMGLQLGLLASLA